VQRVLYCRAGRFYRTQDIVPHPLVEPRLAAAVGLIALGSGLGIGMMLAKTLMLIGLAISLISFMGVIWIYAR